MRSIFTPALFIIIFIGITTTRAQSVYTFTGNGNWSDTSNWANKLMPSSVLDSGSEIIINPFTGGECVLNIPQTISSGAILTILPGINFTILGNLGLTDSSYFTDPRDGQSYAIKKIGTQVWMAQNLNYADSGSYCYDSSTNNCAVYGRLYSWNAALAAVPPGWHIPSDPEWDVLANYLGGDSVAGGKMKEAGLNHWVDPNTGADNSSGLSMLPDGYRDYYFLTFFDQTYYGNWWSSTENTSIPGRAWYRYLSYKSNAVLRSSYVELYGFSVRCVKN